MKSNSFCLVWSFLRNNFIDYRRRFRVRFFRSQCWPTFMHTMYMYIYIRDAYNCNTLQMRPQSIIQSTGCVLIHCFIAKITLTSEMHILMIAPSRFPMSLESFASKTFMALTAKVMRVWSRFPRYFAFLSWFFISYVTYASTGV